MNFTPSLLRWNAVKTIGNIFKSGLKISCRPDFFRRVHKTTSKREKKNNCFQRSFARKLNFWRYPLLGIVGGRHSNIWFFDKHSATLDIIDERKWNFTRYSCNACNFGLKKSATVRSSDILLCVRFSITVEIENRGHV